MLHRRAIPGALRLRNRFFPFLFLAALILAGCQAGAPETILETVVVTEIVEGEAGDGVPSRTPEVAGTQPAETLPAPTPSALQTAEAEATPVPEVYETRRVVLEWPPKIPMGESAIVRLSFDPDSGELDADIEIQGARVVTGSVDIKRLPQYDVQAAALLEGLGFEISPTGEQVRLVTEGEPLEWRWTVSPRREGVQRMNVLLALRWYPAGDTQTVLREAVLYAKGLEVEVPAQPVWTGWVLGLAAAALVAGLVFARFRTGKRRPRTEAPSLVLADPNPDLKIEPYPGIALDEEEDGLFRAVFTRYGRLLLEREFKSGYSGARTFLVQPIRPDGGADARTILKIGRIQDVVREYDNYRRFVADTLPPITARIQHAPRTLPDGQLAALRYTFVAGPGHTPVSLRSRLLENPDPAPIMQLFEVFGPGWWLQRHPYTFRLSQVYDRKLPVHAILSPAGGAGAGGKHVHASGDPAGLVVQPGDVLILDDFSEIEPGSGYWNLIGNPPGENAPIRLRWEAPDPPGPGATGVVLSTRETFLRQQIHEMPRYGLPDPLPQVPGLLNETVRGTRAIIHGDLNLENVLLGPGEMVWLIDFANTGEAHTLFDFAHLQAELIAHVLAPQIEEPQVWIDVLRAGEHPLLGAVESLAARCLFDREFPREYDLALALSCLGALKYRNLDDHQRHMLYLAAAWLLRHE